MLSATWMLLASACFVSVKPTASLPLKRWRRVCSLVGVDDLGDILEADHAAVRGGAWPRLPSVLRTDARGAWPDDDQVLQLVRRLDRGERADALRRRRPRRDAPARRADVLTL